MQKILVLSDTHGGDFSIIKNIIDKEQCDLVVHCGDYVCDHKIMDDNFDYYVNGNNDVPFDDKHNTISFEFEGFKFILLHGHDYIIYGKNFRFNWYRRLFGLAKSNHADVVLFGHTHTYLVKEDRAHTIIANPGSIFLPRGTATYLIIEINNRELNFVKKVYQTLNK